MTYNLNGCMCNENICTFILRTCEKDLSVTLQVFPNLKVIYPMAE